MIGAFSQLASVSAVLGGFSFAFLGAIISSAEHSRARAVTAGLTIPAATTFVLCALGWSLAAVWLGSPLAADQEQAPAFIVDLHAFLSPVFLGGILFFFWAVGASGWVYSRGLGWLSLAISVLATISAYAVVRPFLVASVGN